MPPNWQMMKLDVRQAKALEGQLLKIREKALPFATRETVNATAWNTRKEWQREISENMITRNRWTAQSIRVTPTRSLDIRQQVAIVGSLESYMERQELGGTVLKGGKHGVPLATSYASGEGEGARPRKRMPRKDNRLSSIKLGHSKMGGRGNNVGAIMEAKAAGQKFVYLDTGRRKGIFRILGKKKFVKIKMVYDLTRSSVRTPRNPTMKPAVAVTGQQMAGVYASKVQYQLDRLAKMRK